MTLVGYYFVLKKCSMQRQAGKRKMRNETADLGYGLRFDLRSTVYAPEVKVYRGQPPIFSTNVFFCNNFELLSPEQRFCHHCVPLVKVDQMIPNLSLKGHVQSLT